jgi:hypothetical protein
MYDERGEMYISLFAARFDVLWELCVCEALRWTRVAVGGDGRFRGVCSEWFRMRGGGRG